MFIALNLQVIRHPALSGSDLRGRQYGLNNRYLGDLNDSYINKELIYSYGMEHVIWIMYHLSKPIIRNFNDICLFIGAPNYLWFRCRNSWRGDRSR